MAHKESVHPDDHRAPARSHESFPKTQDAIRDDDRLLAALCYASQIVAPLLVPAIVLLVEHYRRRSFVRYHAVQSLALTLALAVVLATIPVSTLVVQVLPIVGTLISLVVFCLMPVAGLAVLVMYLFYTVEAFKGRRFTVPLLTDFLEAQGMVSTQP
ncbi:MAG: DUF4870 domain-containing protein [Ardenticatenia bacterium]|nr:DUF4870 domain-containing protein [Ardenticatenia bacterium]